VGFKQELRALIQASPPDPARRTTAGTEARLRFTAPFDMSRHPTLTLPGGQAAEGLPVGFQIIGRHMEEALLLRARHAFQQATEWHTSGQVWNSEFVDGNRVRLAIRWICLVAVS
jgi:Asp-tRNA(Asn)/Glu-tRNA(Gln) amidotransferase A subunit family amidase